MTEHDTDPTRRGAAPRPAALLSRREAAAFFDVSVHTFDRMQQDAAIPFVTVGKRRKYLLRDLEVFLQAQRSV